MKFLSRKLIVTTATSLLVLFWPGIDPEKKAALLSLVGTAYVIVQGIVDAMEKKK